MAHGCLSRLHWLRSVFLFAVIIAALAGINCIYDGGYAFNCGLGSYGDRYYSGGGGNDGYFGFSSLQIVFSDNKGMNE